MTSTRVLIASAALAEVGIEHEIAPCLLTGQDTVVPKVRSRAEITLCHKAYALATQATCGEAKDFETWLATAPGDWQEMWAIRPDEVPA